MTRKYRQITKNPIVAVDFDGVIHPYPNGYRGKGKFKPPINKAIIGMKTLRAMGYHIHIWTCRKEKDLVKKYLDKYKIPYDKFIENKSEASLHIDDRNIRFNGSWPDLVQEVESFKLWYERPSMKGFIGHRSRYETPTIEASNYLKHNSIPFLQAILKRLSNSNNPDLDKSLIESIIQNIESLSQILDNI